MADNKNQSKVKKEADSPVNKINGLGRGSVGLVRRFERTPMNPLPSSYIECYIINLLNNTTIKFVTLPEDLNESYSGGMNPQEVLGRTTPYFTYNNNDARSVSYSIRLHEDVCKDMMVVIDELKRLVYPRYVGSVVDPPYCYVKFGDMVNMKAIVSDVSLDWGDTIIEGTSHFARCDVSLSFLELRNITLPTVDLNPFEEG